MKTVAGPLVVAELMSLVAVVEKRGVSILDLFGKYQIIFRS